MLDIIRGSKGRYIPLATNTNTEVKVSQKQNFAEIYGGVGVGEKTTTQA